MFPVGSGPTGKFLRTKDMRWSHGEWDVVKARVERRVMGSTCWTLVQNLPVKSGKRNLSWQSEIMVQRLYTHARMFSSVTWDMWIIGNKLHVPWWENKWFVIHYCDTRYYKWGLRMWWLWTLTLKDMNPDTNFVSTNWGALVSHGNLRILMYNMGTK